MHGKKIKRMVTIYLTALTLNAHNVSTLDIDYIYLDLNTRDISLQVIDPN